MQDTHINSWLFFTKVSKTISTKAFVDGKTIKFALKSQSLEKISIIFPIFGFNKWPQG